MKLWIKILIAALVILILLFSAAYIFVNVKGKVLLTQKLGEALKKEVSIGYLGLRLPLNLEIKDLRIKGLVKVDYIYVSPSLTGLLGGRIMLNEVKLSKPEINWQRNPPVVTTGNKATVSTKEALAQTKEALGFSKAEVKHSLPIIIKYLTVRQGIINFTDRAISEPGIQITLKDVLLDIDNLYLLPKSAVTNFQLTTKIPWKEGMQEGTVYASGWINLYRKDMQARLEIEGIDGIYLYPYYSKWVDLENTRIKEASLNLLSDIQGQNNDVIAKCRLELTDIKFSPRPPDQPEHKAEKIATAVLGIFRALNQGRIILNFTIRTKMDRPEFKTDSISKALDETITQAIKSNKVRVEDAALLPARFLEGVAKGTTGASKAIIEGALSVGKSILDVLKPEEETGETETKTTQ